MFWCAILTAVRKRVPDAIVYGAIAIACIPMIIYLKRVLQYPFPLEYREAGSVLTASFFHEGANPYLLSAFPEGMYVYGFLFPISIAPFLGMIQPVIIIPRIINILFLVLSIFVLFGILRAQKASFLASLVGCVIFATAMCVVLRINGARPDIPAMFFCLGGIYSFLAAKDKPAGLCLSAFSFIVAFYLKEYLFFTVVVLSLSLFFFRSKRSAILYGIMLASLLGLSIVFVQSFFPLYFRYTVLHYWRNAYYVRDHMVIQFSYFIEWFFVLLSFYGVKIQRKYISGARLNLADCKVDWTHLEKPFLNGIDIDFADLGFVLASLLLIFSLGQHTGNIHVYFLELLLSFLLIAVIPTLERVASSPWKKTFIYIACLSCLLPLINNFSFDFPGQVKQFRELEGRLNGCSKPYALPVLSLSLYDRSISPIYDNGATEYANTVLTSEGSIWQWAFANQDHEIQNRYQEWDADIKEKVRSKQFDCIFVQNIQSELAGIPLRDYYFPQRAFNDILGVDVIIWLPKQ